MKGRYVGGFEEVSRFQEAGTLGKMLRGLARVAPENRWDVWVCLCGLWRSNLGMS